MMYTPERVPKKSAPASTSWRAVPKFLIPPNALTLTLLLTLLFNNLMSSTVAGPPLPHPLEFLTMAIPAYSARTAASTLSLRLSTENSNMALTGLPYAAVTISVISCLNSSYMPDLRYPMFAI